MVKRESCIFVFIRVCGLYAVGIILEKDNLIIVCQNKLYRYDKNLDAACWVSLPPTGINRHRRLRKKNRIGVQCCGVLEKDVIFAKIKKNYITR